VPSLEGVGHLGFDGRYVGAFPETCRGKSEALGGECDIKNDGFAKKEEYNRLKSIA
jgi:hypothetical protein